jgi:hypothetical protein
MIDLVRAETCVTTLKIRDGMRDDLSSINWEEELGSICAHIAHQPSDAMEMLTEGDAVCLHLFNDLTYAPQMPGGS